MFRSEVLPAPFGPIIEAIAPRRTAIETSSTARTPPNRFDTMRTSSSRSGADSADVGLVGRALTVTAMTFGVLPKPAAYAAELWQA